MTGFRKAQPLQAALKVAIFGAPGSGKTFTSLLIAEGLAKATGKRIAYIDTEHGTDFYVQRIENRKVHPEPFDIDCLYTRSLAEASQAVRALSPDDYCCIIVDSFTHIWESAKGSFRGTLTKIGTIPISGWGQIKKPYKDFENFLLNSPMHVLMLGRQGSMFEEDEQTGELKSIGVKMKAEGETPYEPNLLIHMEMVRRGKHGEAVVTAFAEKDRTGILSGRVIEWPNFENIALPILKTLSGNQQAHLDSADDARLKDVELLDEQEQVNKKLSAEHRKTFAARFQLADSWQKVEEVNNMITTEIKKKLTTDDLTSLREIAREAMEKHPKPDKDALLRRLRSDASMLGWEEAECLNYLREKFPDWKNRSLGTLTLAQLVQATEATGDVLNEAAAERGEVD